MVVEVADDSVIVDRFEEAPFEVDEVLSSDAHDSHEAFYESLDFFVVVELVRDDGRDSEHPGTVFEVDFVLCRQAVPQEEA